jgi:hypothetical protein
MLHRDIGNPAKSSEEKNTSGPEELNDLKRIFEGVKIEAKTKKSEIKSPYLKNFSWAKLSLFSSDNKQINMQ